MRSFTSIVSHTLCEEKHADFDWPDHIKLYHKYGGQGVLVNTSTEEDRLTMDETMKTKLANLILRLGKVDVQGFKS